MAFVISRLQQSRQWALNQFSYLKQIQCLIHCHASCAPPSSSQQATLCCAQLPEKVSKAQPTACSVIACLRSSPTLRQVVPTLFTACRQQTAQRGLARLFPHCIRGAHGRGGLQPSPASLWVRARIRHALLADSLCLFKCDLSDFYQLFDITLIIFD